MKETYKRYCAELGVDLDQLTCNVPSVSAFNLTLELAAQHFQFDIFTEYTGDQVADLLRRMKHASH